jgi:hypothetical protein
MFRGCKAPHSVSPIHIDLECIDIESVEHLHMLWMSIWVHPYTVTYVPVGAKFWKFGVRVSPNNIMMSFLRL